MEDDRTQSMLKAIKSEIPSRIQVTGFVGAQDAFVLSAIQGQVESGHVFIANDKEEAAYFQNTVDGLLGNNKSRFFPDSFKRPMVYEEINSTNVLQRTETINKTSQYKSQKQVIVTYPEAIFEKVVDPQYLEANKITLEKEETLDVDTIIEVLVEYGFERVDFVYEPGQFSIRGGIVDIFSFGNEWPYRVELFDDEIESIRTFNPANQLSVKNIQRVNIIPNINSSFKQQEKVPFVLRV